MLNKRFALVFLLLGLNHSVFAVTNQVGFSAKGQKTVILPFSATLVVEDSAHQPVDTLSIVDSALWAPSGQMVWRYRSVRPLALGTYSILFQDSSAKRSDTVSRWTIAKKPYHALFDSALKFFYFNRSGTALTARHAGRWQRTGGHPDTLVRWHISAGDTGVLRSPAGSGISKGWYDAGDYGKYTVNSNISVWTLLHTYERFAKDLHNRRWNIPESNNSMPDILDEARWNLEWMLAMQTSDGGVAHKLTTLRFPGYILPADDHGERYMIGKSTAGTLGFAATMAKASRVYAPFDAKFARQCLTAAQRAYQWGLAHPGVLYVQPDDVRTGQYGDSHTQDELFWAAAEMALADKPNRDLHLAIAQGAMEPIDVPSWQKTSPLGMLSLATGFSKERGTGPAATMASHARDSILSLARKLASRAPGYGVSIASEDFVWGSNAVISNQAIMLLHAFDISNDTLFFNVAQGNFDYLLGRNPLGLSYVTGFGQHSVRHPHHRPSEADTIADPVPGMLAGGPHDGGQDEFDAARPNETWKCPPYRKVGTPALSFIDNRCSYATNEIAINWNAALAYVAGYMAFIANPL